MTVPDFREAVRFWGRLGLINFGGPAGQIALMHRELVERRRWVDEGTFLRGLNFCMILPGPEAQQLATYIGWRLHGVRGGIAAGSLFVLPSVLVLLVLSWLAVTQTRWPAVAGLLYGVQPVVVAIVADALIRIGRRTLGHRARILLALAAFVAARFLAVPFPAIVAAAAAAGILIGRFVPAAAGLPPAAGGGAAGSSGPGGSTTARGAGPAPHPAGTWRRVAEVVAVCALLWAIPVGTLWAVRGADDVVMRQALFFTQAAFVTFGGAYAVLAYVADAAVNAFGWLSADQMIQGLGLAESTPGPLIMVTQYVGFLGAWNHAGSPDRLSIAVLGALVTTYVTFLPSFMFILAGAPFVDTLAAGRRVQAALSGVTVAVVGVILNLGVFFGTGVLFDDVGRVDLFAMAAALASFAVLRRFAVPLPALVGAGAVCGMIWSLTL